MLELLLPVLLGAADVEVVAELQNENQIGRVRVIERNADPHQGPGEEQQPSDAHAGRISDTTTAINLLVAPGIAATLQWPTSSVQVRYTPHFLWHRAAEHSEWSQMLLHVAGTRLAAARPEYYDVVAQAGLEVGEIDFRSAEERLDSTGTVVATPVSVETIRYRQISAGTSLTVFPVHRLSLNLSANASQLTPMSRQARDIIDEQTQLDLSVRGAYQLTPRDLLAADTSLSWLSFVGGPTYAAAREVLTWSRGLTRRTEGQARAGVMGAVLLRERRVEGEESARGGDPQRTAWLPIAELALSSQLRGGTRPPAFVHAAVRVFPYFDPLGGTLETRGGMLAAVNLEPRSRMNVDISLEYYQRLRRVMRGRTTGPPEDFVVSDRGILLANADYEYEVYDDVVVRLGLTGTMRFVRVSRRQSDSEYRRTRRTRIPSVFVSVGLVARAPILD